MILSIFLIGMSSSLFWIVKKTYTEDNNEEDVIVIRDSKTFYFNFHWA